MTEARRTVQGTAAGSVEPTKETSADELRQDIERTRQELADTVEELAAKVDMKARAKRVVDNRKQAASRVQVKAANTARMAYDLMGVRRMLIAVGAAAVLAGAVWGAVRMVRVRQAARPKYRRLLRL